MVWKKEAENEEQRPSLSRGFEANTTFSGRQLLIKNASPIKSLAVLTPVLSPTQSSVGSPQDNEERDVCPDKETQIMAYLKTNVGSTGGLKLREEKSSWVQGLKHCSSYMNL